VLLAPEAALAAEPVPAAESDLAAELAVPLDALVPPDPLALLAPPPQAVKMKVAIIALIISAHTFFNIVVPFYPGSQQNNSTMHVYRVIKLSSL